MVDSRDNLILPKPKHLSSRLRLGGYSFFRVYAQAIINSKSAQEVKSLLGGSRLSYPKNMSLSRTSLRSLPITNPYILSGEQVNLND